MAAAASEHRSPSSSSLEGARPLQAVRGMSPEALNRLLAEALEGTGPALLPIPDGTPDARVQGILEAMRPSSLRSPDGVVRLADALPVGDDAALVVTTSGSTGTPKGVELSTGALTASARASLDRIGAKDGDTWLCVLPAGHISGIQVMVRALVGGTNAVHARFNPETFPGLAEASRAHVSLVPTQLRRLLSAGVDLSGLGAILLGGAAAEPELLERARAAGGRVFTTYGMSETCGGCVYDGVPLDGVRIQVDSATPGEPGRVLIGGPTLLTDYRLPPGVDPEPGVLSDASSGPRLLRTNDLGRLDEEGRLRILGRMDEVINTGGHKVVPGPVSEILSGHPKVAEVVVVGRPDPEWGERVSAVVVPVDPADPPVLTELREMVRAHLPSYSAPRELDLRPELPMLASGKPDLLSLRAVS
ncbi:AMP-binding protein [Nocardiopsis alba]|uniref:AMP-binding protein n=1 Tax=Nocardiopsis alba TaxID=53437 RepID=UPI0033A8A432